MTPTIEKLMKNIKLELISIEVGYNNDSQKQAEKITEKSLQTLLETLKDLNK